jgi:hypothetical protein
MTHFKILKYMLKKPNVRLLNSFDFRQRPVGGVLEIINKISGNSGVTEGVLAPTG